ncbi:response regulator transcription factor [Leptothrix sp. BB-4]
MKKILIVEDQPDIRELIRMTLEIEDYDVHEADRGDAAVALAGRVQPDLMLLDVMMPGGIDGFEVCRRMRADARFKRTRIVMLTARDSAADRATGLRAGATDYLAKPFSPRQLLEVVSRVL